MPNKNDFQLKSNLEIMRTIAGVQKKGRKLTFDDLAKETGYHKNTINAINNDDNLEGKKLGMIISLAIALDIPLDKIFKTSEDQKEYLFEIIEK